MSGPNGGAPVRIRHYTDPSCPFAFSAERQRLRLEWLVADVRAELARVGTYLPVGGDGYWTATA